MDCAAAVPPCVHCAFECGGCATEEQHCGWKFQQAAVLGCVSCLKEVYAHQPNVSTFLTEEGLTAMDLAKSGDHDEAIALASECGTSVGHCVHTYIYICIYICIYIYICTHMFT